MIKIHIPGKADLSIDHIVFDFNGTLAVDGKLKPAVKALFDQIKKHADIYILTADTYGCVQNECRNLNVNVMKLEKNNGGLQKKNFVDQLGPQNTICVGNGTNDALMFETCALSIAIIGDEGCSLQALMNADIVVNHIEDALSMLINPKRITATLRV